MYFPEIKLFDLVMPVKEIFILPMASLVSPHCKGISIYVFPKKELHGLSPNLHIHVSVSDLYIPRIGGSTYFAAAK
jgi:hypothetical protein